MSAQLALRNTVVRRSDAQRQGPHDHGSRGTEPRRLRAEAVGKSERWLASNVGRALCRLMTGRPPAQTLATGTRPPSWSLGRASVADALRRDLRYMRQAIHRFVLEYARRRRRRVTIAELRSLDDRLLSDIGLARGQIEQGVDGTLWRHGVLSSRPVGRDGSAETARERLRMAA